MEHSIHLGAGHFIEGVSPMSRSAITKKVQHAPTKNSADHKTHHHGLFDADLAFDEVDPGGNGSDEDQMEDFDIGDAVGKALALVNQVCSSKASMLSHAQSLF
jgi:hypothetical protein